MSSTDEAGLDRVREAIGPDAVVVGLGGNETVLALRVLVQIEGRYGWVGLQLPRQRVMEAPLESVRGEVWHHIKRNLLSRVETT